MLPSNGSVAAAAIFYPETDGLPMSENTRQLNWIIALVTNLRALFRDNPNVFVAGNQFWYPVQGEPDIRVSPDVYAVFGRPKGDRPSYKQWEEGDVPMTVVFEVLSPSNTGLEMMDKLAFYEDHGAEEYYVYDPETNNLRGYLRRGQLLLRIRQMNDFVSPRLGIRFDLSGPELIVRLPDGRPFLTFEELEIERLQAVERAVKAEQQTALSKQDAALSKQDAAQAKQDAAQAKQEAAQAKQDAAQAKQEATNADHRAVRTAELALKVLRQEATTDEVLELQQYLEVAPSASNASGEDQS